MLTKKPALPLLALIAPALGGCVMDDFVAQVQTSLGDGGSRVAATEAAVTPAKLSGPNSIPWQLSPASAASVAQGETTQVIDKPGLGRIRGTDKALAQLDERLVAYKESSKIVSTCKDAFDPQARAAGAYSIEAAASGPEHKVVDGKSQEVFFRIFYADPRDNGVEVRQASIACTVGKRGQLLKATPA